MSTLWLETIFIGNITDGILLTIITSVSKRTMDVIDVFLAAALLLTGFLGLDTITSFVSGNFMLKNKSIPVKNGDDILETVVSITVVIVVETENWDLGSSRLATSSSVVTTSGSTVSLSGSCGSSTTKSRCFTERTAAERVFASEGRSTTESGLSSER